MLIYKPSVSCLPLASRPRYLLAICNSCNSIQCHRSYLYYTASLIGLKSQTQPWIHNSHSLISFMFMPTSSCLDVQMLPGKLPLPASAPLPATTIHNVIVALPLNFKLSQLPHGNSARKPSSFTQSASNHKSLLNLHATNLIAPPLHRK